MSTSTRDGRGREGGGAGGGERREVRGERRKVNGERLFRCHAHQNRQESSYSLQKSRGLQPSQVGKLSNHGMFSLHSSHLSPFTFHFSPRPLKSLQYVQRLDQVSAH